jgi:hypothetical protein
MSYFQTLFFYVICILFYKLVTRHIGNKGIIRKILLEVCQSHTAQHGSVMASAVSRLACGSALSCKRKTSFFFWLNLLHVAQVSVQQQHVVPMSVSTRSTPFIFHKAVAITFPAEKDHCFASGLKNGRSMFHHQSQFMKESHPPCALHHARSLEAISLL